MKRLKNAWDRAKMWWFFGRHHSTETVWLTDDLFDEYLDY